MMYENVCVQSYIPSSLLLELATYQIGMTDLILRLPDHVFHPHVLLMMDILQVEVHVYVIPDVLIVIR